MTNEELASLVKKWQLTLRLQDWDIDCHIEPFKEEDDDAVGETTISMRRKHASILVREKEEENTEHTLVHELIHLHFAPFFVNKGLVGAMMEQAIDALASALMNVKNEKETP